MLMPSEEVCHGCWWSWVWSWTTPGTWLDAMTAFCTHGSAGRGHMKDKRAAQSLPWCLQPLFSRLLHSPVCCRQIFVVTALTSCSAISS